MLYIILLIPKNKNGDHVGRNYDDTMKIDQLKAIVSIHKSNFVAGTRVTVQDNLIIADRLVISETFSSRC